MSIAKKYIISCLLLLTAAGCDGAERSPGGGSGAEGRADCATGGKAQWSRSCLVERDGDLLTLRDAEGGFRRFRAVADGRGLVSADGAESAEIRILDNGRIEVTVGDDRYRLPATMTAAAP